MDASKIMSFENPVFRAYLFYLAVLVMKMMAMSMLTARQRMKNKVKAFANPEDCPSPKLKPKVDENVERVRRAHLNDLENIPIYFVASFGYMLTNPSVSTAIILFRAFTACRFLHTLVYGVFVIPQPARALAFMGGLIITGYMAVQTALHFY